MILRCSKVFLNGAFVGADIRIEDGRIAQIGAQLEGGDVKEVRGTLLPGLIDLHTHGHGGVDTMEGEEAVRAMSGAYAGYGVTSFLPTTMTAPLDAIARALEGIERVMADAPGARVLGANAEGPFIDTVLRGAHAERHIAPPSAESFTEMCGGRECVIRLMTLAPEKPGAAEVIERALERGIRLSAGHTAMTYEQAAAAIDAGVKHVTHLFNAMSPIHHREPGVPTAAMLDRRTTVELIADGVHVHPAVMRMIAALKPEGICLITDSMMAAGFPEGTYALGGQDVIVKDGEARLRKGNLAGSVLTLDEALRRMMRLCGLAPEQVIPMATEIPARAIGLEDIGRIAEGCRADFCVMDEDWKNTATFVDGKLVYGEV